MSESKEKQTFVVPEIRYDIPEPNSYTGRHLIGYKIKPEWLLKPVSVEYALSFDGDDHVEVRSLDELDLQGSITVEAWANDYAVEGSRILLGMAPIEHGAIGYTDFFEFGVTFLRIGPRSVDYGNRMVSGQWVHVAGVYDAEQLQMQLYLNGQKVAETAFEGLTPAGELTWRLGDVHRGFKGMMGEARVWNVARTAEQIAANVNRRSLAGQEGLVAHWKFDAGSGNVLHDASGNDNDGVLHGPRWAAYKRPELTVVGEGTPPSAMSPATGDGTNEASEPADPAERAYVDVTRGGGNDMQGMFYLYPEYFPNLSWIKTWEDRRAALDALRGKLSAAEFARNYRAGRQLVLYRTSDGGFKYDWTLPPRKFEPTIYLVETYRLSSFLGNYSPGRTVSTFSLLPGERTTIRIETYQHSESESASSFLDDSTSNSINEFQSSMEAEYSSGASQESATVAQSESTFAWNASVKGGASWGWGSVEAEAGAEGSRSSSVQSSTAAARTQFAKNVSNAASKQVAQASRQRSVKIDTRSKTVSGVRKATERTIQNFNTSRTLNFVFRQMNQEYYIILHLVDVKLGFNVGNPEIDGEVPLPEMEQRLRQAFKAEYVDEIKARILTGLTNYLTYDGEPVEGFVVEGPPTVGPAGERTHIVRQGENLTIIAQRHGISWEGLADANDLDANSIIRPGDELTIPGMDGASEGETDGMRYWYVDPNYTTIYTDPTDSRYTLEVPGVILNVEKMAMRTAGVMVESLLGQNEALDPEAYAIMKEVRRRQKLANDLAELRMEIIKSGDENQASLFERLFSSSEEDGVTAEHTELIQRLFPPFPDLVRDGRDGEGEEEASPQPIDDGAKG